MFNEGNVYPTIQDLFVAPMFVASGSWIQKDIIFHAGKNILRGVVVFVYVTGNSFMDTGSFPIYNDSIPDVGFWNNTTTSHKEIVLMKDCYQTIVQLVLIGKY